MTGPRDAALRAARTCYDYWIRRIDGTRGVMVTPQGQRVFRDVVGMRI